MNIGKYEVTFIGSIPPEFKRKTCEIYINDNYLCELSHENAVDQIDVNIMDWKLSDPSLPVDVVLQAIEAGKKRLLKDTDPEEAA